MRLSTPNVAEIRLAARQINDLVADQSHWFPKGSGPETGLETDAKSEIWNDPQGFAVAQKRLADAVPGLLQSANASDLAGLKAQVATFGAACKNCHDKYRVPQD